MGNRPSSTSGEAPLLSSRDPAWGERRARYHFAAKYTIGKVAVDYAWICTGGARIYRDAGATSALAMHPPGSVACFDGSGPAGRISISRDSPDELPLDRDSVDLVSSFDALSILEDPTPHVTELARILRPSGRVFVAAPNARNMPWRPPAHAPLGPRRYEAGELRELLAPFFGSVEVLSQTPGELYSVCPIWDPRPDGSIGWSRRLRTRRWLLRDALPFAVKDSIERLTRNRGFYPGEYDFEFRADTIDRAHMLVAICTV